MTEALRYELATRDEVLWIRFAHAATRNALDRRTRRALVELLESADADPAVRVIILTGADPAFTSGLDAKELLTDPDYQAPPVDPATRLRSLRTPTIAAVNGPCVSGGLEIALACSMIIASDSAVFADTHARLGLVPGWGLSVELPSAIGIRRARQMTLTAQPVDARRALEWGLVSEVVPADRLEERVAEIADAIRRLDPRSAAAALDLYRDGQEAVVGAARDVETRALHAWTVDRSAARTAFSQSVSPPST